MKAYLTHQRRVSLCMMFAVLLIVATSGSVMGSPADITFDVPDGSPAELLDWIEKTRKTRLVGETFDERVFMGKRVQEAIVAAADRIVDSSSKADEAQAVKAIQLKVSALKKLGKLGEDSSLQRIQAFVSTLAEDKRPGVAELFAKYDKEFKYADGKVPQLDHDDIDGSIAKMAEFLEKYDRLGQKEVGAAMRMAQHLASHDKDKEKAAEAFSKFADALSKRKEEKLARLAPRLAGMGRQMTLVGNEMDLKGKLLDGTDFDWSKYKGKVVLVDFWATWCGPCVAELPNVLEQHRRYKALGFEVVGISLDNDLEKVETFVADRGIPWKNLFGDAPDTRGFNHPMAVHYGISGIPTAILVDQEGKVVTLRARGPELGKQLEKLLGPAPDAEKKEDTEPKDAA